MKKIFVLVLAGLIPFSLFAEGTLDTDTVLLQTKSVLDQYANKIKALEAENKMLREEMAKAGIKIPLSVYTGSTGTSSTISSTGVQISSSSGGVQSSTGTFTGTIDVISLHGQRYGGFIQKITNDWTAIQGAYKLPTESYIGGYEFVKKGNDNNVFVDIIFKTTGEKGVYDAKILYEYNTGTFQRKLIGYFEYEKTTGYYKTKTGSNPFPGVERIFIPNPYIQNPIIPATASNTSTGATTGTVNIIVATGSVTVQNIEKAYSEKRYLSVISLSNTYLTQNAPTVDVLRIRYRTYFIIGKYTESLAEIEKINALGKLDKAIACDAQVIATYNKNTTLIDTYTKICSKK